MISRLASFLITCMALFAGPWADTQITFPKIPKANETFRFRMVQEMELEIAVQDADEAAAGPSVTRMLGKTTFVFTQKTRSRTRQGHQPVDITYDQITVERSVNGHPTPGEGLGSDLVGKTVNLTYDRDGSVFDVKVPSGVAVSADALKETITSLTGTLPAGPLRIGDVATMPFSAPLPVPSPNGEDFKLAGESRYTLFGVTREGPDRIAEYRQTIEAKLETVAEMALPSGPGKVHISFNLSGNGTLRLNIEKGVVNSAEVQSTMAGNLYMTPAGSEQKLHTLKVHGTTKTSASSAP